MAIGTPTAIGQNSTSAAASSLVLTTTAAVPAGAMIVLEIANHNSAAVVPSSVTDSAGNTYTLISAINSSAVSETLAYALNATALASGSTITITFPSTRNAAAAAYSVTGIATASAVDQQASNTTGSSATPSVGPTSATTQADELVIGLFGYSNSRTFTPGSGYTALATVESTGTVRGTTGEYKIVSATGTQTPDGTFSSSTSFAGLVVTFKAAAAGGGSVALSASGTIAITGSSSLAASGSSAVALSASATIAITGSASLGATGGTSALSASATIAITGSASLGVTGGSATFAASGTVRITGSSALSVVVAGGWHWTRFKRPLIDRYLNVTIAATGGNGYLGVSKDGVSYSWFSGPLAADGRTLTAVADEAAAKLAAVALPLNGVWALPTTTEARVFKLGHQSAGVAYRVDEFYPRRLVEADDIRAESIKAIHIGAGSITGDRLYATAIDGFVITGATIQTAASGARVVLSSAANGGMVGYSATDTYNVATGAGTYQVRWLKSNGKFYAGNGAVILDQDGITVASVNGSATDLNAYKFRIGAQTVGQLYSYYDAASNVYLVSQIDAPTGKNAQLYFVSNGATGKDGAVFFQVLGNNFANEVDVTISANSKLMGLSSGRFEISYDSGTGLSSTRPNQFTIRGFANQNVKAEIGIDTTLKTLVIGALEEGIGWKNIVLANNGGNVGIGSISPSEKLAVVGNINISGVYKNAGVQVLGPRATGWGTPTGTLNRAALTNASTQAQFNQALMALIVDLVGHGAIGA